MIVKHKFFLTLFSACILFGNIYGQRSNFEIDTFHSIFNSNSYEKAADYIKQYEDSFRLIGGKELANWLTLDAKSQVNIENYDIALNEYIEAIRIAKQLNEKNIENDVTIYLFELYRKLRMYDKALIIIRKNIPNIDQFPISLKNRFYHRAAAVYNEFNYKNFNPLYLDTAEMYSFRSIEIATSTYNTDALATSYNELGNIYERTNRLNEAMKVYDLSIKLWQKKDTLNYANAIKNKGSYFLRVHKYDSAIVSFNLVLNLFKNKERNIFKNNCYWGLKMAYKAMGDSLNYYKSYALEESYNALNIEDVQRKKLLDLNLKYETEEKEAEIRQNEINLENARVKNQLTLIALSFVLLLAALLIFYYRISIRKNRKLEKLIKENEFLVGESNHRIKNNLQLITSLIGREIRKRKKKDGMLAELSEKINSIATLHQLLYLDNSIETVSIKNYIDQISNNFSYLLKENEIEFECDVDNFVQNIDHVVHLGLLITELITNSIKHAFKSDKPKKINLKISNKNDTVHIKYFDNGIGIESDKAPSLVNLLIKQLNAEVFSSNEGGYNLNLKYKL